MAEALDFSGIQPSCPILGGNPPESLRAVGNPCYKLPDQEGCGGLTMTLYVNGTETGGYVVMRHPDVSAAVESAYEQNDRGYTSDEPIVNAGICAANGILAQCTGARRTGLLKKECCAGLEGKLQKS